MPTDAFILRSNGIVEILGTPYKNIRISELTFEYTYYHQSSSAGAESSQSYSELDVAFVEKSIKHTVNLLSQKSDWALKHARKLEKLTGVALKRTAVAR